MLKIRGISNAENLLTGVNRFGHCLTTRAELWPEGPSARADCSRARISAGENDFHPLVQLSGVVPETRSGSEANRLTGSRVLSAIRWSRLLNAFISC